MPRGGSDDPKHPSYARSNEHAFKQGSRVAVISLHSEPYFEGWAIVEQTSPGPHCYRVRFVGDPIVRERIVFPEWQADPRRAVALLRNPRRKTAVPPAFSDFFPDDAT